MTSFLQPLLYILWSAKTSDSSFVEMFWRFTFYKKLVLTFQVFFASQSFQFPNALNHILSYFHTIQILFSFIYNYLFSA